MRTIRISQDAATNAAHATYELTSATTPMPASGARPRFLPSTIDRGQTYYWTTEWQLAETEVRRELAEGRGITFDSAQDAIRWLLSDDADDGDQADE